MGSAAFDFHIPPFAKIEYTPATDASLASAAGISTDLPSGPSSGHTYRVLLLDADTLGNPEFSYVDVADGEIAGPLAFAHKEATEFLGSLVDESVMETAEFTLSGSPEAFAAAIA